MKKEEIYVKGACCFRDASLEPDLAAFLYIELPITSHYISVPMAVDISGVYFR